MKTRNALRATALAAVATALWGLAPGCGPSVGSFCNKVCDCVGCSDSELDECVDDLEDAKKAAEDDGCGDEFNDYLSCTNGELTCDDDRIDADGCDSEATKLAKCSNGSAVFAGGASPSAYCGAICDCAGCSDPQLEECIEQLDTTRKIAQSQGCESEYNAVFACAQAELECVNGQPQVDGCEAEAIDFSDCVEGGSSGSGGAGSGGGG